MNSRSGLSALSFCCIAATSFFLSACAAGTHGNTTSAGSSSTSSASVASVTPAQGAAGIALNAAINVKFSSAVSLASINATHIQVTGAQPVPGAVTYDSASNTATFTPASLYAANTKYTVSVTGVTDASGSAVTSFTSSFTTGQSSAAAGDNTVQYQASLFPVSSSAKGFAQLFVLTCGCVTVQTSGAPSATTYSVNFCPAYPAGTPSAPACFSLGSIETDANGNADQQVHFSRPGNWAGDFQLQAGGAVQYATNLVAASAPGGNAQAYMATFLPLTTVNSGVFAQGSSRAQSPITAGTVTWFNGALQFAVTGAAANASYAASENTTTVGGSGSYPLNNAQQQSAFSTDSHGAATFSALQDGSSGDVFELTPQNGQAGLIAGFTAPQ